jgi:nucleoside 2-deoxyribosyltransferase
MTGHEKRKPEQQENFMTPQSAKKKIYLCGPIMDEHEGAARAWREQAVELLKKDFVLLDPMRRNFKDREVDSANEIVEFDLQDIRDADIILVNYNKNSVGTSMEVFYASHELKKFVVAFSPFSFQDCSPWMVRFSTKILPTLERACSYITEHFIDKRM